MGTHSTDRRWKYWTSGIQLCDDISDLAGLLNNRRRAINDDDIMRFAPNRQISSAIPGIIETLPPVAANELCNYRLLRA